MKPTSTAVAVLTLLSLAACGGGGGQDTPMAASTAGVPDDQRAQTLAVAQNPASRVLAFRFGPGSHDAKFLVGPAPGQVTVFGVVGVADGTGYANVAGIDWQAGTGTHRLTFEVEQEADFDIRVATSTGDTEVDVKWIVPPTALAPITPSFALATGPGQKKVQVQLESFGADVAFGLDTALGAGNTEFKAELQFKQGSIHAGGQMKIDFGTGYNKAELLVNSESQHLDLSITPRFMSELSTKVVSSEPSASARVAFNPQAWPAAARSASR